MNFESCSNLDNLERLIFKNTRVNIDKTYNIKKNKRNLLTHFRELSFYNSYVSGLNRQTFQGLRFLEKLVFENSEVCDISSDAFYDLQSITHLTIKSTTILDFDFSQIVKLKSLKYLALYDIRTNSKIDYSLLKNLPNLETLLLDASAYRDLDCEGFAKLKRCEVGLRDTEEYEELEYDAVLVEVLRKLQDLKTRKDFDYMVVCPGQNQIY